MSDLQELARTKDIIFRRAEALRLNIKEKVPEQSKPSENKQDTRDNIPVPKSRSTNSNMIDPLIYVREFIEASCTIAEAEFCGLECLKCHQSTVVRRQLQVRGGDEGASTGFFCFNKKCRHNWVVR